MAGSYSYDQLPTLHETQDIADAIDDAFRPGSETTLHEELMLPSSPSYNSLERREGPDRASLKSVDTFNSFSSGASTGSSIEKLKRIGNRIRRKPVIPGYSRGSIRRHPAAEIEPTRIGRGVWKDQLLVDRSLRSMAALMTLIAIGMIIVLSTHAGYFQNRPNKNTSSVGGDTRPCKEVTRKNTALLLLINVCATMVLGMSNTYQQLITSLKISDLKYVLEKFGDSRVGTNSPFSINHKKEGKKGAWAAWALLILTSMPVHFLANSLIGPSYIQQLPTKVEFDNGYERNSTYGGSMYSSRYDSDSLTDDMSFVCWSTFRIGKPHYPKSTLVFKKSDHVYGSSGNRFAATYSRIVVHYAKSNCSGLERTETDIDALENSWISNDYYSMAYQVPNGASNCTMGEQVYCTLHDVLPPQCRLNVRMNAAFILAACLVVKALYMVAVNLLARGKVKRQCLTFGDVIVASASHPELRVQGECMVNATENYRRHNAHTCHKHCTNPEDSQTGDEIGHCQKCKKWNSTNKFCNEPQPTIATKIKKSLISNLGNTALTQLCLLMFCSIVLLGASIAIAVPVAIQSEYYKDMCSGEYSSSSRCQLSKSARIEEVSGGWGGFNRSLPATSMAPDQLSNEFISFCISNGAQFIYSLLYLMLIYNITLIIQESEWGRLEYGRRRIRTTMVKGDCFTQSYLLQLPKKILFPVMVYSVLLHWMLGEALQTQEAIWLENDDGRHIEHSKYLITYAAYPLWLATFLIILMTGVCWWAFTYRREGFIPQMFGSIRALCAATTQLDDFPLNGIQWGDLGMGKQFRHAGLSAEQVMKIVPNELYAGVGVGEIGSGDGIGVEGGSDDRSYPNHARRYSTDRQH